MLITARASTTFIRSFTSVFLDIWTNCLYSDRERISRSNHRFRCTIHRSLPFGRTVFSAKDSAVSYCVKSSIIPTMWNVQLKVKSLHLWFHRKPYWFRRSKPTARTAYPSWHSSRCFARQVCRGHIERTGSSEIYFNLCWIQWISWVRLEAGHEWLFSSTLSLSSSSRLDFGRRRDHVWERSFPIIATTFVYFSIFFFFYSSAFSIRTYSNSIGVCWRNVRIICSPARGIWLNECQYSNFRASSLDELMTQCACTKSLSN